MGGRRRSLRRCRGLGADHRQTRGRAGVLYAVVATAKCGRGFRGRHHLSPHRRGAAQARGGGAAVTRHPDSLDDSFYAVAEAERFARTLASWRPVGAASAVTSDGPARDLLEVLGIRDARKLDVDRMWSA